MNINYLFKISKKTLLDRSPLTYKSHRKGVARMLLVARTRDNTLLTVKQHIESIVNYSCFAVDVIDVNYAFPFMSRKELAQYDIIALHNTVTAPGGVLYNMLGEQFFKSFNGIKVIFKQDEHYRTNEVIDFIKKYKVDLLLSVWDEKTADYVYRRDNPDLHIMANCLTGYIPDEYKRLKYSLDDRAIDVGYRGMPFDPILGKLGYEKDHIGELFIEHTKHSNIKTDISSKFEDRIYGAKWLDFLGKCKYQLGVESGTDIVDLDGNIRRECNKELAKYRTDEEKLEFVESIGSKLHYRAISPRHFEAIACKSVQILLEGTYQGILVPYRHYIPLKWDFSNINEVLDYINDDEKRTKIANCAYDEIIFSECYSYIYFVKRLDDSITSLL